MYATQCDLYSSCQLELADILMLENVNRRQQFEARLQFASIKVIGSSSSPV